MNDRGTLKAACPLEGGAVSSGSTCGVVSGGCLGIAMAHADDLAAGEAEKVSAVYGKLRGYTRWFEQKYGSTLCRERTGVELTRVPGLLNYLFTGKVITRCVGHVGPSAEYVVELASKPLAAGEAGAPAVGLCGAPVLRGIREDTGRGDELLETISIALDGGVGLSGGLCGALAAALLPIGSLLGVDPRDGVRATLAPFITGHLNMYLGRQRAELWSVGGRLVQGFENLFGSLDCREITGRSFENAAELSKYMAGSEVCASIKDWCRSEASKAINKWV